MMKQLSLKVGRRLVLITVITLTSACASTTAQTVSRGDLGSSFEVSYGTVDRVDKERVESRAPQGAIMGGLIGGVTSNHDHRGEHALEGAVAGALLAALLDGKREAYKYTVSLNNGRLTQVISETGAIAEGDCIALELGKTANIRRVSPVHCENAGHLMYADPVVQQKIQADADACHQAKQMALQASTAEATDIAIKKVRVFCE